MIYDGSRFSLNAGDKNEKLDSMPLENYSHWSRQTVFDNNAG